MNGTIYISTDFDPYLNLAVEEYLCRICRDEIILYLWQNHDTVVIGNSQNAWAECSLAAMEEDGVRLARRTTGGGAVFHDKGNLNYSFIFPSDRQDKAKGYEIIKKALMRCGIYANLSGRNDLTIEGGKKFSGNAFRLKNGVFLHHGTLLVSSETGRMGRYLSPSFDKLNSKGVASVRSRVINLSELDASLTVERLKEALIGAFDRDYPSGTIREAPSGPELLKIRDEMADPAWLYGKNRKSDVTLSHRFSWGSLELQLMIREAKVAEAAVYTDALETDLAEEIKAKLTGSAFLPDGLSARLAGTEDPLKKDIAGWLKSLSL